MTEESWAGWIGIALTAIIGWDKISIFIQSFFDGLNDTLSSTPPIIIIAIVIGLFWFLGKKK